MRGNSPPEAKEVFEKGPPSPTPPPLVGTVVGRGSPAGEPCGLNVKTQRKRMWHSGREEEDERERDDNEGDEAPPSRILVRLICSE